MSSSKKITKTETEKPDVTLESVGWVSALEFSAHRLSACVGLSNTHLARLLDALAEVSHPEKAAAYKKAAKMLERKSAILLFTAPIASGGRVELTPIIKKFKGVNMNEQPNDALGYNTPHVEKWGFEARAKVPRGRPIPDQVSCSTCKGEIAVFAKLEHFDCPHCGQKLHYKKTNPFEN